MFFNDTDDEGNPLYGNARFTGFCIDLLNDISVVTEKQKWGRLNFKIHIVKDGQYGVPDDSANPKTSVWNGMVGELIRGVRTEEYIFWHVWLAPGPAHV